MEIYKNVLCAGKSWIMPIHFVARHKFRRLSRVGADGLRFEKATRVKRVEAL
jgi:hypothetical protein